MINFSISVSKKKGDETLANYVKKYYIIKTVCTINKEGYKMQIDKNMLIGALLDMDDNIAPMLMRAGMHCLGCPASQGESLEEACQVHGIDCDVLVSQINEVLADR
jgi:hybrid cluster-associated redox disulfide protein